MSELDPSAAVTARASQLSAGNLAFNALHPGEAPRRQPVHTVYGGGHLFRADTASRLGSVARRALAEFAPDAMALDAAVGIGAQAGAVYARLTEKLAREPVEDFRIDFEDKVWFKKPEDSKKRPYAVSVYLNKKLIDNYRKRKAFLEEIKHAADSDKALFCFFYGVTPELKQVSGKKNPEKPFEVFASFVG